MLFPVKSFFEFDKSIRFIVNANVFTFLNPSLDLKMC